MTEIRRTDPSPSRPGPSDRCPEPDLHLPTEPREEGLEKPREDIQPPAPEQQAFRATFLWRFHRPEVVDAFRLVGDALIDLQNEAGEWGPKTDRPLTWGELHAAADDLDHLVRYLEEVASDREASELDEVSEGLAIEASGWADRLTRLVTDMRRSLETAAEALDTDPS